MKKFRYSLLLVVVLALCAGVFAACDGEKVSVSLDANGGTCTVQTVTAQVGKKLAPVPAAERDGYVFEGWFKSASGGERWNFETDKVKGSMTLYAGFRPQTSDFVGVTYHVGDGVDSAPVSRDVRKGNLLPVPSDPVKDGYRFDGWFKDSECKSAWDFGSDTVDSELTLYAKWSKIHTVTVMHGQERIASVAYEDGAALRNVLPLIDGLVYTGLYEDAEFNSEAMANSAVTKDVTYYARYEKPTPESFFDYESEYGYVNIKGLKDEFDGDEVIIPESILGIPVRNVSFDSSDRYNRVVISSNVISFDTHVSTEKLVISPANVNYATYDDCIYRKESHGNRCYLMHIPENKRVITVMPGAQISGTSSDGKIFVLSDDAYAHENDSLDYKRIVVPDEYYNDYSGLMSNVEGYLFRKSEMTGTMLAKNGKLYMWIEGDKATVGTDDDGITEIVDGALYGVHEVTFGENITSIEGKLFSNWSSTNGKADSYKYTFLGSVPQRTTAYEFFPQVYDVEGDTLEIKVTKEYVTAYKDDWNMDYYQFKLVSGETSLVEDGKLIAWFGGDTAVVGTATDGITVIGDGALYGVHDITIDEGIAEIEGYNILAGYEYGRIHNISVTFLGDLPVLNRLYCPINTRNGSTFVVNIPEQYVEKYAKKLVDVWKYVKIDTEDEFTVINGELYKYNGNDTEIHIPAGVVDVRNNALPENMTKLYLARTETNRDLDISIFGLNLISDRLDVYVSNGHFTVSEGSGTRDVYVRYRFDYLRFFSVDEIGNENDKAGTVTFHVDTSDTTALEYYTKYCKDAESNSSSVYTKYEAVEWEADANA